MFELINKLFYRRGICSAFLHRLQVEFIVRDITAIGMDVAFFLEHDFINESARFRVTTRQPGYAGRGQRSLHAQHIGPGRVQDREAEFGTINEVLDQLKVAGAVRVNFATVKERERSS